jgi:tyrosine-protein phosphatase YwqE
MSLFSSIFGKKKKEEVYPELTDLSVFKTDIHSHLIPGIDDGVKTMEESIEMIKGMHALGFNKIITSPHIMSDSYRNTPEIIKRGLDDVRKELVRQNINVELGAAAEYYIDEGFLPKLKSNDIIAIQDKYLLFEISYINPPDNLLSIIFEINVHGYTPVMAHPERYPFWYQKFDEFHKIREAGALLQLNTNSLAGYYGGAAKHVAEKMIDHDMIDFIGSDLHGQRHLDCLQHVAKEKYLWKLAARGVKNQIL